MPTGPLKGEGKLYQSGQLVANVYYNLSEMGRRGIDKLSISGTVKVLDKDGSLSIGQVYAVYLEDGTQYDDLLISRLLWKGTYKVTQASSPSDPIQKD